MKKTTLTKEQIISAYNQNDRNWTKTASFLGISRPTLNKYRTKLGVNEALKKKVNWGSVETNDLYDAIASYLPEEISAPAKADAPADEQPFIGADTFGRRYTIKELKLFDRWGTRMKRRPVRYTKSGGSITLTDEELANGGFIHNGEYYLHLPMMARPAKRIRNFETFEYKTQPYDASINLNQTYEDYKNWKGNNTSTPLLTEEEYKQKQNELRANLEDELAALNDGAYLA